MNNSLYRDEQRNVQVASFKHYDDIHPNAIDDTLGQLADREIRQQMGGWANVSTATQHIGAH